MKDLAQKLILANIRRLHGLLDQVYRVSLLIEADKAQQNAKDSIEEKLKQIAADITRLIQALFDEAYLFYKLGAKMDPIQLVSAMFAPFALAGIKYADILEQMKEGIKLTEKALEEARDANEKNYYKLHLEALQWAYEALKESLTEVLTEEEAAN